MPAKATTDEQDKKIVNSYLANSQITFDEIGDSFEVSRRVVGNVLRKNNIPTHKRCPVLYELSENYGNNILELYNDGENCPSIANRLGLSKWMILRYLKSKGVEIRNSPSELQRKYTINQDFFEIIDSDIKAYILGFWYADGCNLLKTTTIRMNLQSADREILERFVKEMNYNGPVTTHKPKRKNRQDLSILSLPSRKLCEDLIKLGCPPKKTFILKFPTEDQVPKRFIRAFIRGYFDGDGNINFYQKWLKDKDRFGTWKTSISIPACHHVCHGLYNIVKKELGLNCHIDFPPRYNKNLGRFSIHNFKNVIPFMEWLYQDAPIFLQRKYDYFHKLKEAFYDV